ncbi:twin-arginine translocase TatA/TatE family subunit [Microbacterium sp. RD1]|uniref:twin-arginine translocase TatA/TatE family subunit n=1 Tax=Microbacterium sp. RD1 TaxID=3457313 RepID=UPI003FA5D1BD
MFANFTGWHLLVVLAVILLLFGAAKLPALAKSMGQSARVFRGEIKEMKKDDAVQASAPAEAPETRTSSNVPADRPGGTPESSS